MAKRSVGRPRKSGGEARSVRIGEEIVKRARLVAMQRGMSITDYLASLLEGPVERDYRKAVQELANEEKETGK